MNKQSFMTILLTMLMSMVGAKSYGHDIAVANSDGKLIYYEWTNNHTELAVSKRSGYYGVYYGNVVIPEFVEFDGQTYSVTSIGEDAFDFCPNLTSISIPNSVTSIGRVAFSGCSGLTSLTIPNSVTIIGNQAFSGCSSLTSIIIPKSVTSIGHGVFDNCKSLTSIIVESNNMYYDSRNNCNAIIETQTNNLIAGCKNTIIPNSVTSIEWNAFYGCSGLTSVTIPGSVKSIGVNAFNGCGLTSLTILNGVTSIDDAAFQNCSSLVSLTISNSVTSIGGTAFSNCSSLTSITIPNSVTSIGWDAFSSCSGLESISVESGNTKYDSRNNCNAIIETQTNTLLTGCKNTIIPNSVTSIGWGAFSGCSGLTSITIPNSVISIGGSAFSCCSGLTSVTIPNSVTSIGGEAFYGCSGLTSVTIPNSITNIGSEAFYGCSGLTSVNISDISAWLNIIFEYQISPDPSCNPLYFAHHLFLNGEEIKNLVIPDGVTKINNLAFAGCSGLTSVSIPNSVTSIGEGAFQECSGLTSIIIPNSVTSIGGDAFSGTGWYNNQPDGLVYAGNVAYGYKGTMPDNTSITIKDGTVEIADYAFSGCKGLTSITIPNSVMSIGNFAFYNCSSLTSISILSSLTSIGRCAFDDTGWYNNQPDGLVYAGNVAYKYKGTMPDNTSITIKDGTVGIAGNAFYICRGLTSITIPNSVMNIGNYAFFNCTGVTTITSEILNPFEITDNVFYDHDHSIYATATLIVPPGKKNVYQNTAGWDKFTNIEEADELGYEFDSDGVRFKIGENNTVSVVAINGKYFGDVVIPSQVEFNGGNYTVTSIATSAFEGCTDLTSVSIPSSVTVIGASAFEACIGLKAIEIPSGVTTIENGAFYYCTGLKAVDIPNGVTSIGEGAFSQCSGLTSLTIPSTVTSIDTNAFFKCSNLNKITSGIENPFVINQNVFPSGVYVNATLYVPAGTKSAYKATSGWKKFENMVEITKCAKPTIAYSNGKISFSCETAGVEYHYTISNNNSSTGVGSWVNFSPTVNISVYATKSGYTNSDTATAELEVPAGLRGDLNNDGTVNVADHVELSNIIMGQ